jgi:ornithine cyclodeaminase/alanine dehydrogenase-like protein (mu-crystallin family)
VPPNHLSLLAVSTLPASALTEDDIRRHLDPARVISAIEDAFRTRYPSALMPLRTQMNLGNRTFLLMPCYDRRALGIKLIMVTPEDPREKLRATYLLLDPQTGCPKLTFPANYLTEVRTAAASAVATKFLAREDVKVLGIFGAGRQARSHLKLIRLVRNFERFLVSGPDPETSRYFAQQMAEELGAKVESVYSRACAAESDVLCTCTTSPTPLFDGHLIRPGTHINAIGAFQPHTREVDDVTVQHSKVIVDTYDGALAEAGDLLIPLKNRIITRNHLLADLHEVVSGKKRVRTSEQDITLFKSVGCALEDLVTAELLQS